MILLAAFLIGDAWTWNVTLRYFDREGDLLVDRERWTLSVGKSSELTAERVFIGTLVDADTLVPPAESRPETLTGRVEEDGSLSLKGDWNDPAASKALRRLLKGDKKDDRVPLWPVARRAILVENDVQLPGSDLRATLRIDVVLAKARLGGKEVKLPAL